MHKVLLVDDEVLTRDAIRENIPWDKLGYELIGACADGKEAIDLMQKNQPDLILTDICMPHVDGLQLAKYVYENCPNVKVIIISGYDDFDYAKQALTYQVKEYILKPITSFELTEVLTKTKQNLDEEKRSKDNFRKIQQAYQNNIPLMKDRFLNHLIYGQSLKEDMLQKLRELDGILTGKNFCVVLLEEDDCTEFYLNYPQVDESLARFAIFNIAQELIREELCGLAFQNAEDKAVLLFEESSEKELEQKAVNVTERIRKAVSDFLSIEISAILGKSVEGLSKLRLSYENARSALEYRFLMGSNRMIYGKDILMKKEDHSFMVQPWIDRMILAVKANQAEELEEIIHGFFKELVISNQSKNKIYINIQRAVLTIMMVLDEADTNEYETVMQKEKVFLAEMYEKKHIGDVEETFTQFCLEVSDLLSSERDSYCRKQAVRALDYIEKNYGDHEISLNTLCSYLCMSTSYFSSVFKNVTGETFIEALTKKRIEKAKALIENTSMKTYEIADVVGYVDPHYFSSSFKKMTGSTPTEYAKKVR